MNTVQLLVPLVVLMCGVAHGTVFQFMNNLKYVIWVGSLGNDGRPPVAGGGFILAPGQGFSTNTADDWAGRFWGRTGCGFDDGGNAHCETGDCGNKVQCDGNGGAPPVTLVEISLKGAQGLDFYDISLVDGFNVPMQINPLGGTGDGSQYSCAEVRCTSDINSSCPSELRDIIDDRTVACKSACLAFNTDQFCCRGEFSTSETCKSTDWPVNYPAYFKEKCPDAYSYAYDDQRSTFTCKAPAYLITFGST